MNSSNNPILILGAGPGGLTAAYWLLKYGYHVTVIERDQRAGGLMRSVKFNDYTVDYGYKQLYSRIPEVHTFWGNLLGADYLSYKSRIGILYDGHILEKDKSIKGLKRGMPHGLLLNALVDKVKSSYHFSTKPIKTLEDSVHARRGALFTRIFSQGFDERFKGLNWSELPAPQSPGRKGLLSGFFRDAVKSTQKQEVWFHPSKGTGQIIEQLEEEILRMGGSIKLGCEVTNITQVDGGIYSITIKTGEEYIELETPTILSSLPLQRIAPLMGIELTPSKKELSFQRGVLMIYLFLNKEVSFPHTCLQVSCPTTRMSRLTNYSAYGGQMVPKGKGCICVEYFSTIADELFSKSDQWIYEQTLAECEKYGLLDGSDCEEFLVIRNANADPAVSWEDYTTDASRMKLYEQLSAIDNFYQINRTGTDKSTYAGMMAARSIRDDDKKVFDVLCRPDVPTPWESGAEVG